MTEYSDALMLCFSISIIVYLTLSLDALILCFIVIRTPSHFGNQSLPQIDCLTNLHVIML